MNLTITPIFTNNQNRGQLIGFGALPNRSPKTLISRRSYTLSELMAPDLTRSKRVETPAEKRYLRSEVLLDVPQESLEKVHTKKERY